jgi:hypothetical protein
MNTESSKAREEIIKLIKKSKGSNIKTGLFQPTAYEHLDFIISEGNFVMPPDIFSGPIVLKSSWNKKISNELIIALMGSFMMYTYINSVDLSKKGMWIPVVLMIVGILYMLKKFFDTTNLFVISNEGLSLYNKVHTPWQNINYLFFKTTGDDEGVNHNYLVAYLKNGNSYAVEISNLSWSKEKLGQVLYLYMKKFNSDK